MDKAQTIRNAVRDIMKDPTIALVLPLLPDLPTNKIKYSDDISTIGDRQGMLVTLTATAADNAVATGFLVYEKLCILKDESEKTPNLFTRVLGIQKKSQFKAFFFRLQDQRNRLAHPPPIRKLKGDPNFGMIQEEYKQYARLLIEWDASPYLEDSKEAS